MKPAVSVDDLDWLLHHLRDTTTSLPAETRALVGRCEDFLVTAIDVRHAQQTRSRTTAHRQLMDAYYTARDQWLADREKYAAAYPAEEASFAELHPRPTLKAFMQQHALRHRTTVQTMICPACGQLIEPVEQVAA